MPVHRRAAGVDIGATFHVVAVPPDLVGEPVRSFKSFTADLNQLAEWLTGLGITFLRAQVGDRNVLAMLQEVGGTLGGETSGHILCLDKTTTGDGIISALQVLAVMKSTGAGLAELCAPMPKFPLFSKSSSGPIAPTGGSWR